MNKTFRILEIIWLALAGVGVVMCVYSLLISDTKGSIYFIVFAGVSVLMYWVRKKQRIRFEEKKNSISTVKKDE